MNLLPKADGPRLVGGPWVTVFEHDREKSPRDTEKVLGIKAVMPRVYFDPAWHVYNEGLVKIGGKGKGKGPVEVRARGHLIHKDGPVEVAGEIVEFLGKVEGVKSKI